MRQSRIGAHSETLNVIMGYSPRPAGEGRGASSYAFWSHTEGGRMHMLLSRRVRCAAAVILASGLGAVIAIGGAEGASKFTVAYIAYSLSEQPQQQIALGMKNEAAKYGYTVNAVDGLSNSKDANSLMQTEISQGANAIVLDSWGKANLEAGLQEAHAAKIPVYLLFSPDSHPYPDVAVDVRANAGTASTQAIIKNQGKKGSVLEFTLPIGANCVSSAEQFSAVMKKYPGWKIQTQAVPAPGWAEVAAATTKAWLLSHPKGGQLAIWGCWDGPSEGAASALAAANRFDVKVYGQDTDAGSVALLEKRHYEASFYFNDLAVGAHAIDLAHGNASVPFNRIKPAFESYPPIEVTQQNVRAFVKKFPSVVAGG